MTEVKTTQVFVIGCPRSGTSALSWALAQHPELWTSAESDFMHDMFRGNKLFNTFKAAQDRPDQGWLKQNRVTYREFAGYLGRGIDELFRSRSRGLTWVDQTPGHTLIATPLSDIFPNAKFVHIVRDGKLVVNSMLNSGFNELGFKMEWATDFEEACRTWKTFVEKGQKFSKECPDRVFEVRNEQLSEGPDTLFRDLQEFLDLELDDSSSKFISQRRLNSSYDKGFKTVERSQTTQGPIGLEDWDGAQIEIYNDICGELACDLGYSLIDTEFTSRMSA